MMSLLVLLLMGVENAWHVNPPSERKILLIRKASNIPTFGISGDTVHFHHVDAPQVGDGLSCYHLRDTIIWFGLCGTSIFCVIHRPAEVGLEYQSRSLIECGDPYLTRSRYEIQTSLE